MSIANKVALITGANRGIGAAIARVLARKGVKVVVTGRKLAQVQAIADEINSSIGRARAFKCDVTQFSQLADVVRQCHHEFGQLDILVNNAGTIDPIARLEDSAPELWAKSIDTNLKGTYFGLRAALPIMRQQGKGTIINISSGAANSALEGWSHYCTSKAGVKKITECGHAELAGTGIKVIGLSPGTVATDMMARIKASGINPVSQLSWESHITPEWVGEAVAYLCSPEGAQFAGTDFSLKTEEGRRLVGLG